MNGTHAPWRLLEEVAGRAVLEFELAEELGGHLHVVVHHARLLAGEELEGREPDQVQHVHQTHTAWPYDMVLFIIK
jgi:hypothetical protein